MSDEGHPNTVYCPECLQPAGMPCIDGYEVTHEGELLSICALYHEERILSAAYKEKFEHQ